MNLVYLIAARRSSNNELRHSSRIKLGMPVVYLRQNLCVLWLFVNSTSFWNHLDGIVLRNLYKMCL
jgi:hypothetical protein